MDSYLQTKVHCALKVLAKFFFFVGIVVMDTCDITALPRKMFRNMLTGKMFRVRTCSDFVYDGDTLDICFELNGCVIRDSLRIKGYDSPELKTNNPKEKRLGYAAKFFLKNYLEAHESRPMFVVFDSTDKWGRLLGDLYVQTDDATITEIDQLEDHCSNICDIMIRNGHGYEYYGGTKKN